MPRREVNNPDSNSWRTDLGLVGVLATMFFAFFLVPPPWPSVLVCLASAVLVLVLVHLRRSGKKAKTPMGSALANALGPFVAQLYIENVPTNGITVGASTDHAIQLVVFFGSYIALTAYLIKASWDVRTINGGRAKRALSINILVALVFFFIVTIGFLANRIDFVAHAFLPGHALVFGREAPDFTSLTICRGILTLFSLHVALAPDHSLLAEPPGSGVEPTIA